MSLSSPVFGDPSCSRSTLIRPELTVYSLYTTPMIGFQGFLSGEFGPGHLIDDLCPQADGGAITIEVP